MLKKVISCFILLSLLLCMVPGAAAAGSASWSGPSVIRAGDTITLSFKAGGGIYGGSGSVSYDSSLLTLQKYTQVVGGSWAVEFSGNNFVFYDNSMTSPLSSGTTIFSATFQVNASAAAGSTVTVSATGVKLSNGQADTSIGTVSYQKTVSPPLSGNCNLASMNVSNATLSPAFSPSVTSYKTSVPYSVSKLSITAKAEHSSATVSVSNNSLAAGATTTVKVTVTAENGATKTYTIKATREQDPNYVESSNAKLKSLSAEGFVLSPAFNADTRKYYVWLPYEASTVKLNAEKADGKATLNIGTIPELTPGKGTDIPITVTAEDGTQLVYTVTVVRAPENADDFLNPVPETTEPETEPTTEPVTEPTESATEPTPEPAEENADSSPLPLVITGILSAAAGAGIMFLILFLLRRRKNSKLYSL